MNTLTKLALGMMGQLRAQPARGNAATSIPLPEPKTRGGMRLTARIGPTVGGRRHRRSMPRRWTSLWLCLPGPIATTRPPTGST